MKPIDASSDRSGFAALLGRLEIYYDTVPRMHADVEDIGAFTMFVTRSQWPFYARPRLGPSTEMTVDDVRQVLDRQRELHLPRSIEWVAETTPRLEEAALGAGMHVEHCPLMLFMANHGEGRAQHGCSVQTMSTTSPSPARPWGSRSAPEARDEEPKVSTSATPPPGRPDRSTLPRYPTWPPAEHESPPPIPRRLISGP